MKKIILFLSVFMYSGFIKAQDYAPFPKDSLFFVNEIPNDEWMPLIKTNDPSSLVQITNSSQEWSRILLMEDFLFQLPVTNNYSEFFKAPMYNWLGKTSFDGASISFVSATGDSIYVNTELTVIGASYNIQLNQDCYNYGDAKYLNIALENYYEITDGDSIKKYSFTFLDENLENTDYNYGYDYSYPSYDAYNINTAVFSLSKNHGILKSPAFYYFPYSKVYERKGFIDDLLDLTVSHAYKVFYQEPGDEIHTEMFNDGYIGTYYRLASKKVCIDQNYDEISNAFYTTYDVWTTEERVIAGDPIPDVWDWELIYEFLGANYTQEVDTVYLNDYPELNQIVPNGLSISGSENAFFYVGETKTFRKGSIYTNTNIVGDEIELFQVSDGGGAIDEFAIRRGGMYYDHTSASRADYYKIKYFDLFDDDEWGNPFEEAYLLGVASNDDDLVALLFEGDYIQIESSIPIIHASIYDIQGQLIENCDLTTLDAKISTAHFTPGLYFCVVWDGQKLHSLKFVKR